MKGISLKGGMPFGFGGVYEKNSLYAILLGAAGPELDPVSRTFSKKVCTDF